MTDTYWGIQKVSEDADLRSRVSACAAQQNLKEPETWAYQHRWVYGSAPTWAEKYEYAELTHPPTDPPANPPYSPGADSAVITDGDILSQVQKMIEDDGLLGGNP